MRKRLGYVSLEILSLGGSGVLTYRLALSGRDGSRSEVEGNITLPGSSAQNVWGKVPFTQRLSLGPNETSTKISHAEIQRFVVTTSTPWS